MTRATLGSWGSYAATFAFQVAFAYRFGTTDAASAYVLVFALVMALSGVFASAGQTLAVPRLSAGAERLSREGLALWFKLAGALGATLVLCGLGAQPLADLLARSIDISEGVARDLIHRGLLVGGLQFLAVALASVSLARGSRFGPAIAPALPAAVAILWLLVFPGSTAASLMLAFALGSALQCLLLVALIRQRRYVVVSAPFASLGPIAAFTVLNFAALSALPPIERFLAAGADPRGVAHFDYALRTLLAVQQLIVAGVVLASLGDWSTARFASGGAFAQSVRARLVVLGSVLSLAATVALVGAPYFVALAYERGEFTRDDTETIARLLRLALPSFVASGIGLLLSQALVAARRNRELVILGLTRFTLRTTFGILTVSRWGVGGLVAGISMADTLVLLGQVFVWRRVAGRPDGERL